MMSKSVNSTIELPKDWKVNRFDDFLDYIQPTQYIVESIEYDDNYRTPVLTPGKSFIKGYTNETLGIFTELPVIIFDDFTTANKFVNFPFKVKSSAMKILKPKDDSINIKFVFYYMQTVRVSFDTHKRYWISVFSKIPVPTPPKTTQQAIVSKIEELFSELDKGIENVRLAQKQLKTYRQSVLNALVTGKNSQAIESVIIKLDQGWSPKCENQASTNKTEWAVIKTSAVQHGHFLEFENKRLPKNLKPREQHELMVGDILITRAGPRVRVGVCCMIRHTRPKLINCDKVYRIKVNSKIVTPQYFEFILNTPKYQDEIERMKSGISDSGLNLTQKAFLQITIPVPTIKEQNRLVMEIESRLSVADKMEESITQSLQQAEALRQSILKKAFEGRLVKTEEVTVSKEATKVIPFERKVMAGKIIHLLHDSKQFGLTKFQKTLYIVENFAELEYETNFLQETAGPYDKYFTTAFRKEMQEKDWVQEEQHGNFSKLVPGDSIGSLISSYATHFRSKGKQIVFAIQQLKDKSIHEAELIATLYAVWNNKLIAKKPAKESELIADFFNWSPKKKDEFQEQEVIATYKWMKKVKLVPVGFGKLIL